MTNNIVTTGTVLRSLVTDKSQNAQYLMPHFAVKTADGSILGISGQEADLLATIGTVDVLKVEEDPKPPTPRQRWNLAIKAIRTAGTMVQQNIAGCCNGCSEPFKGVKKFDAESTPGAWFIFAQDSGIKWHEDGLAVAVSQYGYSETSKSVYFNHANGGAQAVADAFREQGFDVEWDGNEHMSVKVTVPARLKARWER